MNNPIINNELCVGCGECIEVCFNSVIKDDPQMGKAVVEYPENCNSCGRCEDVCEECAITIFRVFDR